MNSPISEDQIKEALEALNIIFQAAITNMPSGLLPAAQKAQQEGISSAGQHVADFLTKCHEPFVAASVDGEGVSITDFPKEAKSEKKAK